MTDHQPGGERKPGDRGGNVDLSAMLPDAVADCRRAWARLDGSPQAVAHGDAGPANIRISADGAGLLDWDEAGPPTSLEHVARRAARAGTPGNISQTANRRPPAMLLASMTVA